MQPSVRRHRHRRRSGKSLRKKFVRITGGFGLLVFSVAYCFHTLQMPARPVERMSPLAALTRVPVPELPARAVELVRDSTPASRVETITNTLWAVSGLARPGVMPYVVSALCRSYSEFAGLVVETAVQINNTPLLTIISAAITAAPDRTKEISVAAFKANPAAFQQTAMVLAERTGISSTNILQELCEAVPNLQPYVESARLQASQMAPNQSDETQTNQSLGQLSVILPFTMYDITNSGQTLDEVLSNNISPADTFANQPTNQPPQTAP